MMSLDAGERASPTLSPPRACLDLPARAGCASKRRRAFESAGARKGGGSGRVSALAAPGVTERDVELAISDRMRAASVEHVWTITNVGLGENARICFPTHPPTELAAAERDVLMVDVHPITPDGFWGDCTRCQVIGDFPEADRALHDLEALHREVAGCRPGMPANELFGLASDRLTPKGFVLLDLLANIGHSLAAVRPISISSSTRATRRRCGAPGRSSLLRRAAISRSRSKISSGSAARPAQVCDCFRQERKPRSPMRRRVSPSLSLEALSRRFGETLALAPTDFSVQPGEFVSIVGPSGCGKSTLFNLVAGVLQPTAGRCPDRRQGRDRTAAACRLHAAEGSPAAVADGDRQHRARRDPEGRRQLCAA